MTGLPKSNIRMSAVLLALFSVFSVAFVWLSLLNPSKRPVLVMANLSSLQISLLILAVVVPYICIWFAGLIGYLRLRSYAKLINNAQDGAPLGVVATGVLGVLLSLPIASLFSAVAQVVQPENPEQALLLRQIGAYVGIALLLWAFYQLMVGARTLLSRLSGVKRPMPKLAVLAIAALGCLYVYFVLTNPLFISGASKGHLPAWVVIDTIVFPRLLAWYWGLCAAWYLYQYAVIVPGKLYRLAFSYFATGIGVVTLSIALLQYVQAISAVALLPLGVILLVVYGILTVISAGFMLLARGGKELAKIEAV